MASQIVLRRPSMPLQRPKIITGQSSAVSTALKTSTPSTRARCAEVAGGTAAECAAVCCCCPCGVVDLIVLVVVRLPAALCRKAIKKRRQKKKICILDQPKRYEDKELQMDDIEFGDKSPSMVVSEMEKEMWTKLYGTGFWRNPSESESVNGEKSRIQLG